MEFVNLEELVDEVLAEAPGCPIYTARDKIRLAAIDFCKQAGVSVETTFDLDVDADENIVQLPEPGSDVRVWQILWIKTTENTVLPVDRRSAAERNAQWDTATGRTPLGYVRRSNTEIQLIPIPTEDLSEVMTIHCSYVPKRDADRLDAVLIDEYRDVVVHGALSRLFKMSKEAWYDRVESIERGQFFQYGVNEARALADKDFLTGPSVVQMRPFA